MNLQEYLMMFRHTSAHYPHAPRIECKDGFSMSVQANEGAYCTPRKNVAQWTHVEVGFPSACPEFFAQYAENADDCTETVYGYVPVNLVEKCIAYHGGMVVIIDDNEGGPGTDSYFSFRD